MKRKLLKLFLLTALTLSLVACGKSEEEKELEAIQKELEKEGLGELGELADAFAEEEAAYQAEQKAYEEAKAEYKVFPKSEKWNSVEKEYGIQIDDVFIEYGSTLKEVMDAVNASSVTYVVDENDYTEQKIVNPKDQFIIDYERDGKVWFQLFCFNSTDEVISANECIVYHTNVSDNAKPFSYILGRSYDEWMALSYDEFKTQDSSYLEGFENVGESSSNITLEIKYKKYLIFGELGVDAFAHSTVVSLKYDMNTNSMKDASYYSDYFVKEYTKEEKIESFNGLSLSDLENVVAMAEEELALEYEGAYEFTLKKLLLIKDSVVNDDEVKITLIYGFVDEEGRDNIRWVDVEDVKIINDGTIEGESADVNSVMNLSGLTTLEEAVEGAISYYDLLDEMDIN